MALGAVVTLPGASSGQSPYWSTPSAARGAGSGEDPGDDGQRTDKAASKSQAPTAVTGRVRSVDPSSSTVTMEDGTILRLPPAIQRLNEAALRDGVSVEAAVDNQGGYNVVRDLRITGRR